MSPTCLDHFRTISEKKKHFSTKKLHFARVTFQFLAHVLAAWTVSADIAAVSGRSRNYPVGTRAVLAGVAEKPLKNRVKGLNVPLVAQAAQVASAQPERLSILPKQVRPASVGRSAGGSARGTYDPRLLYSTATGGRASQRGLV